MNLALDYDNTYTCDPQAWNEFIEIMQRYGHTVYCVTMRSEAEGHPVRQALANRVDGIFFTNRAAKKTFMYERGISISVWIDDTPEFILMSAAPNPLGASQ